MRFSPLLLCSAFLVTARITAQEPTQPPFSISTPSPSTTAVFRHFSDRVVKIQVTENGSAAKAELGSGFFVASDGTVITNYHVISKIITEPGRYHAELTDVQGTTQPVHVAAIDVVHDLAVLRSSVHPKHWFTLDTTSVDQGERLYSMGHPHDLGLSVVEGTYNGLLEHTLYPKIHFTGAINPGMSGGPTMTSDGQVIGINVATAGNDIGFLVPVARARALLATVQRPGYTPPKTFLTVVAQQIRAYQDAYLHDLFLPASPTIRLGDFYVPTRPAPFFKCWADAHHREDQRYDVAVYQCSTDDELFISDDQQSGVAEVEHLLITSHALSASQFASLLSDRFGAAPDFFSGDEDDVTKFECQTHNVANGNTKLRVAFCARAYKKLPALYDAVVRIATLGSGTSAIISTLRLSGVTFENARTLASRYVRSITWKP